MTAEVDVFESESVKLAVAEEQQRSLDLANANGVFHGIPKDDADGSYVFVTGTDVKDDHLAPDSDLSTQLSDENGEALQSHFENNGGLGFDCETGATKDENRINVEAKAAEHIDETPLTEASGCNCEPPPQHSDAKVEVEGGEAIHGLEAHELEELEISVNNNFQILPSLAESKSNSVIDANEYEESDILISIDNNFSSVTSQNKEQFSEAGDCGGDMELDSRAAPCLEADTKLPKTIDNGSVPDDIGDKIKQPTVLKIEVENGTSCPANDTRSEAETCHDSIEGEEKVNNDASDIEPGVSNRVVTDDAAIQLMTGSQTDVGRRLDTSVDKNGGSPASVAFKSESEAENAYALKGTSIPGEDAIVSESKDLHSLAAPAVDSGNDFVHVESHVKPTCQEEAGGIDEIRGDEASTSSLEDNSEGQNAVRHIDASVDDDGGSTVSLIVNLKPESEVENTYPLDDRNMSDDSGIVSEARDLHNPAVGSGSDFVCVESGDKPTCQEAESIDGILGDEASTSSPEDNLEGQNVAQHIDICVDKNGGSPASLSVDFNPESEIEIENTYTLDSKNMSGDDAIVTESRDLHNPPADSGSDFVHVEGDVKPTCQDAESNDGIHEDKALTSSPKDNLGGLNVGQHLDTSVDNDGGSPASLIVDFEPESALDNSNMSVDDGVVSESRDLPEDSGIALHSNLEFVHTESDAKQTCQEAESIDGIPRNEAPISSPENNLEGQDAGVEVVKRPFYFLIRIPRYDDENLREQIKLAQLHVEEKTKSRDAIRAKIQMKRATCKQYDGDVQSALTEERAARDSFKSKRHEMDSVQFMINKVKNAISVEDIDGRIRNMEHMIEHETLPLREEKLLIREIKQLKQLREQLSSSIGKQEEIQQALDQKDQIEERLKVLRKEFDLLKDKLLKAEAVTQAARKIFNDENVKLKELQSDFKAADGIRQEAFAHLQNLKKQQYEKNKYFWRYKDDVKATSTLASSGDKEQLQQLCVDQVERIMEIWNKDDDFRKEYVRCNTRSTLRRLRTLDGRSLGPDEEPPVISYMVNDRLKKNNSVAPTSTLEQEKQVAPVKAEIPDKSAAKVEERENKKAKTKNPAKHASSGNGPTTISGWVEVEEEKVEEKKLTKEEEELARKAEELRKEEAAAKLKEQRRLEEKVKAKEAQDRKKRYAEKSQVRAAIKAQKEAEEKQKEREKRAMKKERKKANTTEAANGVGDEGDSALAPSFNGTPKEEEESETKEKPKTTSKRPQKASQFAKQTRANSIPLPLRNRNKRRMQPWMWVVVAVLAVLALFLVGNLLF